MAQLRLATSGVHFRRGFHDNGFAKTILLVEPTEPFLGMVRLDKLPYENVDLKQYYPGVSRLRPSYAKRRVDHPLRLGRYLQIIGLIDAIFQ